MSVGTQSVVRALRIVRAFSDARAEWSLAELSRELSLSKPTAFRLLGALEQAELVTRTAAAGTRWPAHAASTGKVLLAAAQEEEPGIARRLAHEAGGRLPGLTPATIRSGFRLAAELAQVSRQGYSTAINELEEGYVALGAPVRRHDGRVVAAISLGGPATRFTASRIPRMHRPLREFAVRISRRLGWHDAGPEARSSS